MARFRQISVTIAGFKMGFRDWRQISTILHRFHCEGNPTPEKSLQDEWESAGDVLVEQAGHTAEVAESSYSTAREFGRAINISGRFRDASIIWWGALGFLLGAALGMGVKSAGQETERGRERETGPATGGERVVIADTAGFVSAMEEVIDTRLAYTAWARYHRALLRPSAIPSTDWFTLQEAFRTVLRLPEHKDPFKSDEQAWAAMMLWRNDRDLIVVLPTGGGKTAVFLSVAQLTPMDLMVVIVPFRVLLQQHSDTAVAAGFTNVGIWGKDDWQPHHVLEGPPSRRTGLLFAPAESFRQRDDEPPPSIVKFLIRQAELPGHVIRLVIDEVQEVLHATYRPDLIRLPDKLPLKIRRTALTGSLSPGDELRLDDRMHVRAQVIRGSTDRPEVRLQVSFMNSLRSVTPCHTPSLLLGPG